MLNIFGGGEKTDFELGYMYECGVGGKDYDDNKAIEHYQKVCDDMDIVIDDIDKLWQRPRVDKANKIHCKEAVKYLKIADNIGCAGAYCQMGGIYKRGIDYMTNINTKPNIKKALECYKKAAKLGSVIAYDNLGYMYNNGEGVVKDCNKSNVYYEKSANMEVAICHYYLGIFSQYYTNTIDCALHHYEAAGQLGFIGAYKYLAYIYKNGVGVEINTNKANEYDKKASDLENTEI